MKATRKILKLSIELPEDITYDDVIVDINASILESLEEQKKIITWEWKEGRA